MTYTKRNILRYKTQIKKIEKEIQKYINQHPDFKNTVRCLASIPGVGMLLAANFLTATVGFNNDLAVQHRKAAAFIGICPYEHSSGSSVYKRPRTPKYGPSPLKKIATSRYQICCDTYLKIPNILRIETSAR